MELAEAWDVLGVAPGSDSAGVRARYLSALVSTHPDRSDAADATLATARLNEAYRIVQAALTAPQVMPHGRFDTRAQDRPPRRRPSVSVSMIDDDTIAVEAPMGEAFALMVEVGHELGEVDHVEPGSAMISIVVEFLDIGVCQVLFTLQGRATGVTEVWCTADGLDRTAAPPIDAVTRLVLDTMLRVSRR